MSLKTVCDKCKSNHREGFHRLVLVEQDHSGDVLKRHYVDLCDDCRDEIKALFGIDQPVAVPEF